MAFYLHRAFATDEEVHVLNDLRLVDPDQPEHDGRPGIAQIDHLVIHRHGMFIVESKSVHDEVTVRDDGSGEEWTRSFRGRKHGFASPIKQAERQAGFLRAFLHARRKQLLGKAGGALGALAKVVHGTNQRGFSHVPIQIIVAISDKGRITRVKGWKEPSEPFRCYVVKADNVADKIREEMKRHKEGSRLLGDDQGEYGIWCMKPEEVAGVAALLASSHSPASRADSGCTTAASGESAQVRGDRTGRSASRGVGAAACKSCGGSNLSALWGRYGYYWKCADCGANTSMPTVCSACGAEGRGGHVVRIRKEGAKYFRCCEACGIEERIWTES